MLQPAQILLLRLVQLLSKLMLVHRLRRRSCRRDKVMWMCGTGRCWKLLRACRRELMLVMIVGHLEEAAAVRRRVKLAGLEVRTDWVKESAAKQMILGVSSVRHARVVGWPAERRLGRSALQEESTSGLVVVMVVETGIAHLFIGRTATVDEVQKVVVLLGLIGHGLLL